jgi:hypothetical protein
MIRYQVLLDGTRVEIKEYEKLKRMVWSHATLVMDHLIKARAQMLKAGLEVGIKRPRPGQAPHGFSSPSNFKTFANTITEAEPSSYNGKVQRVPPPPNLPAYSDWMCPHKLRSPTQINNTYRLYVSDQTPQQRVRLMKERRCLICKKAGHYPEACKHAPAAFKNGTAYWYPESCIIDSLPEQH